MVTTMGLLCITELVKEHKLKERIRQRDHRDKAAAPDFVASGGPSTSAGSTPYRTTQALGKAVKRALACITKLATMCSPVASYEGGAYR